MEHITDYMRVTKKRKAQHDTKDLVLKPAIVKSRGNTKVERPSTVVDCDGELYENGIHVPKFIYRVVKYEHKNEQDQSKLSKEMQRVLSYIETHYDIPLDFERNKKFGPHSGMTYATRLTRAYKLKLLHPKSATAEIKPICISCSTLGHVDKDCPAGF